MKKIIALSIVTFLSAVSFAQSGQYSNNCALDLSEAQGWIIERAAQTSNLNQTINQIFSVLAKKGYEVKNFNTNAVEKTPLKVFAYTIAKDSHGLGDAIRGGLTNGVKVKTTVMIVSDDFESDHNFNILSGQIFSQGSSTFKGQDCFLGVCSNSASGEVRGQALISAFKKLKSCRNR